MNIFIYIHVYLEKYKMGKKIFLTKRKKGFSIGLIFLRHQVILTTYLFVCLFIHMSVYLFLWNFKFQ